MKIAYPSSSAAAAAAAASAAANDEMQQAEDQLLAYLAQLNLKRVRDNREMRDLLYEKFKPTDEIPPKRRGRVVVWELLEICERLLGLGCTEPMPEPEKPTKKPRTEESPAPAAAATAPAVPVSRLIEDFSPAQMNELKAAIKRKELMQSLQGVLAALRGFSCNTPSVYIELTFADEDVAADEWEAWMASQWTGAAGAGAGAPAPEETFLSFCWCAAEPHREWEPFVPTTRYDRPHPVDQLANVHQTVLGMFSLFCKPIEMHAFTEMAHRDVGRCERAGARVLGVEEWVRLSLDFVQWHASLRLRDFMQTIPLPATVRFACARTAQFCPTPLSVAFPAKNMVRVVWTLASGWTVPQ